LSCGFLNAIQSPIGKRLKTLSGVHRGVAISSQIRELRSPVSIPEVAHPSPETSRYALSGWVPAILRQVREFAKELRCGNLHSTLIFNNLGVALGLLSIVQETKK
jgi:hypothetical protein